jgi:purine-binding chemotaxis protein CheW
MDGGRHSARRFASFTLEQEAAIELAIDAEKITEATTVSGPIRPLPSSVDYLEGVMQLRDDTIPVINLKKRLKLPRTGYPPDAKVAVIQMSNLRFGVLFDDIRDVLRVPPERIHPLPPGLLTAQSVITDLIKLDQGRTLERIDLQRLIGAPCEVAQVEAQGRDRPGPGIAPEKHYSRYVVFTCRGRDYGVGVDRTQEITWLADIDDEFKDDLIEGTLKLRGDSIPLLSASRLLQAASGGDETGADSRVLVLQSDDFRYGLIVDRICEIISVEDKAIMPIPHSGHERVHGIFQRPDGKNIMLIEVNALIEDHRQALRSVARLKSANANGGRDTETDRACCRGAVSTDCYLIFSIGKNFAVALTDVQEIIEAAELMDLPAATGYDQRVLNLRGTIVPVINLRQFLGFDDDTPAENKKLIIAIHEERRIALEVDNILTLHKQVQSRATPSLNPRLQERQDALDRLIEFTDETGSAEHVLVINIKAIINNHLGAVSTAQAITAKEQAHDNRNQTQPSA